MSCYFVTREWNCDLDRKAPANWYVLYISNDFNKALKYANELLNNDSGEWDKLFVCKVPYEKEIDFIKWENYKVAKLEVFGDYSNNYKPKVDINLFIENI